MHCAPVFSWGIKILTKMCRKAICNMWMFVGQEHTLVEYAPKQRANEKLIRFLSMRDLNRVSRYFGHLLRRKNATGWAHSKGEPTSIGQARRHLIDPFTQDGQISIEDAVVEWEQFDPHHLSVLRNRTGKL